MQLRSKPQTVRRQLAAAVISLLGTSLVHAEGSNPEAPRAPDTLRVDPSLLGPAPAPRQVATPDATYTPPPAPPRPMISTAAAAHDQPWQVDSGLLWYKEGDSRVQTTEAVVNLKRSYADESSVVVKLTVDSLTGGSPNGALPSNNVQTFSTPSGTTFQQAASTSSTAQTYTTTSGRLVTVGSGGDAHSTIYTVSPGQLPLDTSFHDERVAMSVGEVIPLGSTDRVTYGGGASHELDFVSISGNAAIAHDLNSKNTTLSAGVNLEGDSIRPIGGAPVPWSEYGQFKKEGNKSKRVEDFLVGITQIMSRRWIAQINYSLDRSTGYQNDPYKIISALNADGSPVVDPLDSTRYIYVYEKRPELRTRKSIYWDNKFAFDRDVLQLSFRHMTDDWGISSQTIDLHYRWALGAGAYLEPHGRWYRQTAADFFHFFLQGNPSLAYASADPRLAKFDATTVGLKFGIPLEDGSEFSFRLERYVQKGNGPATVPPLLQGLDLYPGLRAWIVQGGLSVAF